MHCSGCGKNIPFTGQVCPYCHRDKSINQQGEVLITVILVACLAIGYFINGFTGLLWGAGIGGILAVIAIIPLVKQAAESSKPPEVRISPSVQPVLHSHPEQTSLATRLEKLDELRARQLVSEAEYSEKRRQILNEL